MPEIPKTGLPGCVKAAMSILQIAQQILDALTESGFGVIFA